MNEETKDVSEKTKFLMVLGTIEHKLEEMIRDRHYMNDNAIKQRCEEIIYIIGSGVNKLKDSDD